MMNDAKLVCHCRRVTIGDIRRAIADGAQSFEEVQAVTGVSTGCKRCADHAQNVAKAIFEGE